MFWVTNLTSTFSTMGIFPIIMNIVQFWLIDSIVKASEAPTLALQTDTPRHSHEDREPLFGVPSDDEDEVDAGHDTRHDIENPQSPSQFGDDTKVSTPNENKSTPSGGTTPATVSDGGTSVAMHAYPPSAGTSPSSRRSSMSPPAGGSRNRIKRSVPAPLHLQFNPTPAINSPELSMHPNLAPHSYRSISTLSITKHVSTEQDSNVDWVSSWDDSDDWANKVGEDDWTGKRMEYKKEVLSEAWGSSPLPQRVGNVGS